MQLTCEIPAHTPAHTLNHRNCPGCAGNLRRVQTQPLFPGMSFAEAAPVWLAEHAAVIAHKTFTDYEFYIRVLSRFFGELRLDEIHAGHLRSFADERASAAGPSCINHEINTVKQILSSAKLWGSIAKFYKPLEVAEPKVGQAMEPAAEQLLFEIASTEPRWRVAYLGSILTATTTAGPGEITHLHVNDIDLGESAGAPMGTLRIRDGLKNGYRARIVPLNESSRWAAGQLLKRYYKILRRAKIVPDPDHYLLPGRGRSTPYNPWKPMGSWKKAWHSLRTRAGMPTLRMYDLRHHSLTKLMEDAEVSEPTIEEVAGHALSSQMKKRYSHIRMKPKSEATAKLELKLGKKPAGSAPGEEDARLRKLPGGNLPNC